MLNISKDFNINIVHQIERYINDEERMDHIPQPTFIVGSRGSGKSTLLRSLMDRLAHSGLSDKVQSFDGKQFFNSYDIIRAIEGVHCESNMPIVKDNDENRRIVIIDDLDYFFKRSSFDIQYILRNYLNRESAPLLIATISGIDESLTDYRAPFFEGIRLVYIPPLSKSIISTLDIPAETQRRMLALMEYLPPVVYSLKLASEIVTLSNGENADIKELLNRVAPSYRFKLERLPVYSQKILYAMAMSKAAVTLAELRELTGLPGGTLSTYLRQMVKSGEIRKTLSPKRGTPYVISDNLFKLWISSQTL